MGHYRRKDGRLHLSRSDELKTLCHSAQSTNIFFTRLSCRAGKCIGGLLTEVIANLTTPWCEDMLVASARLILAHLSGVWLDVAYYAVLWYTLRVSTKIITMNLDSLVIKTNLTKPPLLSKVS